MLPREVKSSFPVPILTTGFALPCYRARFDSRDPCRDLSSSDSLYIFVRSLQQAGGSRGREILFERGAHVEFLPVAGRLVLTDLRY